MFAIVSRVFQVFLQVFHMHVLNVSLVFTHMLQMLHLDVSKVDRVMHLPARLLLSRLGVSSSPFVALHPSHTAEGARRRSVEVRAGDGNVDMSTCSSHFCNRQEYDFRRTPIFF
jgi:hypothetical protein